MVHSAYCTAKNEYCIAQKSIAHSTRCLGCRSQRMIHSTHCMLQNFTLAGAKCNVSRRRNWPRLGTMTDRPVSVPHMTIGKSQFKCEISIHLHYTASGGFQMQCVPQLIVLRICLAHRIYVVLHQVGGTNTTRACKKQITSGGTHKNSAHPHDTHFVSYDARSRCLHSGCLYDTEDLSCNRTKMSKPSLYIGRPYQLSTMLISKNMT